MAVSGVGEAVAAPILGYWTNRTGLVVPPLIGSIMMSIIGNVIYMCLNEVPVPWRKSGLLLSRFLNGAGSGNRGTYFAYIAAASEPGDRARSMALSGGGALIGLNIGPAVQMLFTWIGSDGIDIGFMRISMYTAPAVLAIAINLGCMLLLMFLNDGLDRYNTLDSDSVSTYSIAAAEDSDLERNSVKTMRMDVLAVVVCMWTRAARMLITANVESIGSPFSQVMFGLDKEQVLNYNAMMQGAVGVLTTVMFVVYVFTPYSKWISERLNCLGAMVALLLFHLITFSWPFLPGKLLECSVDGANNLIEKNSQEYLTLIRHGTTLGMVRNIATDQFLAVLCQLSVDLRHRIAMLKQFAAIIIQSNPRERKTRNHARSESGGRMYFAYLWTLAYVNYFCKLWTSSNMDYRDWFDLHLPRYLVCCLSQIDASRGNQRKKHHIKYSWYRESVL
ncbi:hypothetical protein RB195_011318 [Necator americanus]|uniref:Major facilitator superfamily (MFS) profile domain-containing protein n=1 Tax=Necator americanus TaxID=51031 RepID=A0ABR1D1X6_NECAM